MLADTGITSGHATAADLFFLIATIVFVLAAFIAYTANPKALWAVVLSLGLGCTSLALLLL